MGCIQIKNQPECRETQAYLIDMGELTFPFEYYTFLQGSHFLWKYRDSIKLTNSEDILDIGCLTGDITVRALYPFAKRHIHRLIGADISKAAIKCANEENGDARISFQVMDITDEAKCGKYNEKFGHIFAFYLFHLVHRSDLWSKNVYNMLKPKGQLFATILLTPNPFSETMAAQKKDNSKPWSKFIQDLPEQFYNYGSEPTKTIGNILIKEGFVIETISLDSVSFPVHQSELYRNTLVADNSFFPHVPEEFRKDYAVDFMTKMLQHVTREDGRSCFRFNVVVVIANKP